MTCRHMFIDIPEMSELASQMNKLLDTTNQVGGVWFFQFYAAFDPIFRNYVFRLAARTL